MFGTTHKMAALVALVVPLTACATRHPGPLVFPHDPDHRFEPPTVDLSDCAPVSLRRNQEARVALALALSGGGHRAANFAAGVMMGLEELSFRLRGRRTNALLEVDYLSAVSGGNLAAASYISSLHDYQFFSGSARGYSFRRALEGGHPGLTDPDLRAHLQRSLTGLLISSMMTPSVDSQIDRGDYLQEEFNAHHLGSAWREQRMNQDGVAAYGCQHGLDPDLRFRCMFAPRGASSVRLPYWVANATAYENGAVFAFTPDQLKKYGITGYKHRLARKTIGEHEEQDAFISRIPLALGTVASCAFPAAVPARTVRSDFDGRNPYLQLGDGGLSDNLGVETGLQLLREDEGASHRVLLVVDAYTGEFTPFSRDENPPGMLSALIRIMSIALDTAHGQLDRRLREAEEADSGLCTLRLSFEDFEGLDSFSPLKAFGLPDEDLEALEGESPFTYLRSIATAFSISERDQRVLFAAGRYAVMMKGETLLRAMRADPAIEVGTRRGGLE